MDTALSGLTLRDARAQLRLCASSKNAVAFGRWLSDCSETSLSHYADRTLASEEALPDHVRVWAANAASTMKVVKAAIDHFVDTGDGVEKAPASLRNALASLEASSSSWERYASEPTVECASRPGFRATFEACLVAVEEHETSLNEAVRDADASSYSAYSSESEENTDDERHAAVVVDSEDEEETDDDTDEEGESDASEQDADDRR